MAASDGKRAKARRSDATTDTMAKPAVAKRARPRGMSVAARLIETEDDVAAGIRALRRRCELVRLMHDKAGLPPLRRREAGLEGLARIVVGQQLSVASAAAIWGRTEALIRPFDAEGLLGASEAALRGAGLSTGKVRTLRAVASAVVDDGLDLARLDHLPDEDVHAALTGISGIGPWTADIFIMFCLGRADGFAAGDLALQVALQMAAGLEARPTAKELAAFAERWRPWRGVAARLLWAYYKVEKDARSGVPV
jgi:DNA-3-methyladenine glycosylase II